MRVFSLLVAVTLVAPAGPAAAQTLQEALALAYSNNPTLLSARAQLRAVDEQVPIALSGWRPSVTIASSVGAVDSRNRQTSPNPSLRQPPTAFTGFPTTNPQLAEGGFTERRERGTMTNQLTITQPVFRGGGTVARVRQAENNVLTQRAQLFVAEQDVLRDAVNSYVAVIRDQELLRLRINNEQVLTEQLRATNERFRVGEITRTDVAQAESRLAGATADRAAAEGTLQVSRATYQQLIGAPPERLIAPQPLKLPVRNAAEAAREAATNNPSVVSALFAEASARDNIDVTFATLLPTVSVSAQVFRNDNQVTSQTRQTGGQVVAQLNVPLYQGGAEYAGVRQARQTAQQRRQDVDVARRLATQTATQAWEQLQSSRAQVEANRVQIRAAEIALDGVQREAIVGSRTTLDVLNAEQELLNARTSLVQSLATVVAQSYALARAVGRLTAQDLGLPVELYDMRAYYAQVRNRWAGLGDYSDAATRGR